MYTHAVAGLEKILPIRKNPNPHFHKKTLTFRPLQNENNKNMQVSDDLFNLIKSLTKAEKRYFKMHASLQKGEKDYLLLFDEIESQVAQHKEEEALGYDEAMLKGRLKNKISQSQFHVMKNYLTGLILKSLRGLREKSNIEEQIATLMSEARLLEQKGLYEMCLKKLETLKAACLKYERYTTIIEVLEMERILYARTSTNMIEDRLEKTKAEMDRYVHLIQNTLAYSDLRQRMLAFYRRDNRARSESAQQKLAAMLDEALLQDEGMPATFQSKISFYHAWAMLSFMQGDLIAANKYYKSLSNVWIGYPHFKEEYPSTYIIYTSNYLVSCHMAKDYGPFEQLLEELKGTPTRSLYEEAEAFQNICFLEQLYFMNKEIFGQAAATVAKAKSLATEIENGLKKHGNKIVKSRELSIIHNSVVMFFALGLYDEVLHWVSKIQSSNSTDQRKEVQLFARLVQLLIYTEKGEHLYIDNAFKAFEYHLKKEDKQHDFEGKVTYFLKQIAARKQDKKTIFTQFKEELKRFESQKLPGHEEISIWVESKLQNKPFLEILKEKMLEQPEQGG